MNCRHCNTPLKHVFLDLGFAPPSNAYLNEEQLHQPESYFPLKLFVCDQCWLVQTEDYLCADKLFRPDYAYFSSISSTWLDHAARYATMITKRLKLDQSSFVIEVAANDGYLLKNFVASGIPCLGIEPTAGTAAAAEAANIPILREFFGLPLGLQLAATGRQADLIIGNNVYAHVPDINDFTAGLKAALKPGGTITLEFPHLLQLIRNTQFDTVYHEHYSYLSLTALTRIFSAHGLNVFDVEELSTHGGSLRIYAQRTDTGIQAYSSRVNELLVKEALAGITKTDFYFGFQTKTQKIKDDLLTFLLTSKQQGKTVAAYGAAAKGNTLMNYAGIRSDLISFVVDRNPAKQGKFMPGSHIPIVDENRLLHETPSYVIIFPWNIQAEVITQLAYVRQWGGKFVTPVPKLEII